MELALRAVDDEAQPELRECAIRAILCWAEGGMWPRDEEAPDDKNKPNAVASKMVAESPASLRCLWRTFESDMQLWVSGGMKHDRLTSNMIRCVSSSTALCLEPDTRVTAMRGLVAAGAPALVVKCVAEKCCDAAYVVATVELRKTCLHFLSILVDDKHNGDIQIAQTPRKIQLDSSTALLASRLESSLFLLASDVMENCSTALHTHTILRALISASFGASVSNSRIDAVEALENIIRITLDYHLTPVERINSNHDARAAALASLTLASCTESIKVWQRQEKSAIPTSDISVRLYQHTLRILRACAEFLNTGGGGLSGEGELTQRLRLEVCTEMF